jgi:VCBS repeat-containing protein
VRSTDAGGLLTEKQFTITVNHLNHTPTDIALSNSSVAENQAAGTTVGTLSTTDSDPGDTHTYTLVAGAGDADNASFQISGSTLQTTASFDFETKSSYSIRVQTDDGNGSTYSEQLTISVTNVNEAPAMAGQTFAVNEGAAQGTIVGAIIATDPDAGQTLTYSLTEGNTDGAFTLVGNSLRVNNSVALNFTSTPSFTLKVQVTDSGNPASSTSATVTVTVTDVNGAPIFAAQEFSINENAANNSVVGLIQATDPDAGPLTYSITAGNASGAFTLVGNSLQVANSALLDFETTPQFGLTVLVTDNGTPALSTSAMVTITLKAVNEAPVLTSVPASVSTPELVPYTFTAAATDPEKDALSFSLVNAPAGAAIDAATGVFTWTPTATQGPGTYAFKVRVADTFLVADKDITITVTEVTIASFTPLSGPVGTRVTLTGTNLNLATRVQFNEIDAAIISSSSSQLITTVPLGATTGLITVLTQYTKAQSKTAFKVTPAITSFAPASGPAGTQVTITGTNLDAATSMEFFNGVAAASFTVLNSTSIVAIVPVGARTGKLTVTTPNGSAKSDGSFTVTTSTPAPVPPTILSFTPTSGPEGTVISLTGTNLSQTSEVLVNGLKALVSVSSNVQLLVTVPAGATSGFISVTTPYGTAVSTNPFKVTPAITSFSPTSGPVGTRVTIKGTTLGGATQVTFDGIPAMIVSNTATEVVAVVPAGARNGQITVTTAEGKATTKDQFRVTKGVAVAASTSSTVVVEPGAAPSAAAQQLQAYPNPVQRLAWLSFSLAQEQQFSLQLFDMRGSLVRILKDGTAQAGQRYEVELDALHLSEGIYMVRLVTKSQVQVTRISVSK